jgi:hypothetical protein
LTIIGATILRQTEPACLQKFNRRWKRKAKAHKKDLALPIIDIKIGQNLKF